MSLHSSQKPFPAVDAMSASVMRAAGQPVEDDGNPWKAKYDVADYTPGPDLRDGMPGGYPPQRFPLRYNREDFPITHVKSGFPPYTDIDEATITDVPSWATSVLHNTEESGQAPKMGI